MLRRLIFRPVSVQWNAQKRILGDVRKVVRASVDFWSLLSPNYRHKNSLHNVVFLLVLVSPLLRQSSEVDLLLVKRRLPSDLLTVACLVFPQNHKEDERGEQTIIRHGLNGSRHRMTIAYVEEKENCSVYEFIQRCPQISHCALSEKVNGKRCKVQGEERTQNFHDADVLVDLEFAPEGVGLTKSESSEHRIAGEKSKTNLI